MPSPRHTPRLHVLVATAAMAWAWAPSAARAQSDDSDLLAPLVPPNDDDLLEPLVPPNNDDLLEPLVPPNNDDMLEPLVPPNDDDLLEPLVPKPKPRRPGKVTHKDEIEIGPVENGFMLVKRKVVDPCGDFEISWGGRKTCHATEREKWEYIAVGGQPSDGGNDRPEDDSADDKIKGRSPGGGWPGPGPGPGGKSPGPGGNGPGPGGNGPGPAPGNGPAPGPGPSKPGSTRPSPGKGGAVVVAPAPDGFVRLRDFAVRLDSLTIDPQGRFDITLTLRNAAKASKPVANGDWTVTLTDADGLGFSSHAIWMPGAGPAKPFRLMPTVAPGATQRLRFVLEPGAVRTNMISLSVQQNGAPPARFGIPADKLAQTAAPEPEW